MISKSYITYLEHDSYQGKNHEKHFELEAFLYTSNIPRTNFINDNLQLTEGNQAATLRFYSEV